MGVTGSRRRLSAVAFIAVSLAAGSVQAQTRAETLRYVTGASVNTLDPNIPGSTREAFAVSLSTYDRLVSFGRKQTARSSSAHRLIPCFYREILGVRTKY